MQCESYVLPQCMHVCILECAICTASFSSAECLQRLEGYAAMMSINYQYVVLSVLYLSTQLSKSGQHLYWSPLNILTTPYFNVMSRFPATNEGCEVLATTTAASTSKQ